MVLFCQRPTVNEMLFEWDRDFADAVLQRLPAPETESALRAMQGLAAIFGEKQRPALRR